MCSRVGLYDMPSYFFPKAEEVFTEQLWQTLPDSASWSEYYVFNLLASAHLSPLVFGVNLIPNSRLPALPADIRERLAMHGVDYSLSIGNLWPDVFKNLTDQQIEIFVSNLPDQEPYVEQYLDDIQKGEFPLEHQGLYYVFNALDKALALNYQQLPDFDGNYLMKAFYLFRHPNDEEVNKLTLPSPELMKLQKVKTVFA